MWMLVTGGAGFIGSHLVEKLLEKGRRVICLDNFSSFYNPRIKEKNLHSILNHSRFRLLRGDIRDRKLLQNIFSSYSISEVVHLAAKPGVRPSIEDPYPYLENNVQGTVNLLEMGKDFPFKKFIFASSSSVYGARTRGPFREEDKVNSPISPYAASKSMGELISYTYHHLYNFPTVILRFFTVYGPRQRPEMAIHKFTRLIEEGREIPLFGDGHSRRDYTYISDVIEGIVAAVEKDFAFEIFNLGNSKTVELRHLISLIEDALGKKAKIKRLPEQPGDVPITFADISKSKRLLGYNPQVEIEEGISKFVEWFRGEEISILST